MKQYWSSTQDFFTFCCSQCFQMLLNFRNNFGSWRIQRRFHRYNNQERDRIEPLRNIQMDTGYLCDNRYIWQIWVFTSKPIKTNETRISRDVGVLRHMKIVAWTAGVTWVDLSWIGDVVAIYSDCCNTLAMGWVKIKKVDWNRCGFNIIMKRAPVGAKNELMNKIFNRQALTGLRKTRPPGVTKRPTLWASQCLLEKRYIFAKA